MNIYFTIGIILIAIFILSIAILLILIFNDRSKLNEICKKKDYLGKFHGGTFYSQPLIPLEEDTNEEINKIIRAHNKKITLFYFSFFFLIGGIVFFNIGD